MTPSHATRHAAPGGASMLVAQTCVTASRSVPPSCSTPSIIKYLMVDFLNIKFDLSFNLKYLKNEKNQI
jgi:hypothetical protein